MLKDFLWIAGIVLLNLLVYLLFKHIFFWDTRDENTFIADKRSLIEKGKDPLEDEWIQKQIRYKKFVRNTPILFRLISLIIILLIIL